MLYIFHDPLIGQTLQRLFVTAKSVWVSGYSITVTCIPGKWHCVRLYLSVALLFCQSSFGHCDVALPLRCATGGTSRHTLHPGPRLGLRLLAFTIRKRIGLYFVLTVVLTCIIQYPCIITIIIPYSEIGLCKFTSIAAVSQYWISISYEYLLAFSCPMHLCVYFH
jgi:hypothetical protein